jgi:hypothetical protein
MARNRTLTRGAVVLAVLGLTAGALIAGPAGAAFNPTRAKIKKIANKQATKVFDSKIGPATAPFEEEADLLYATVNNAGAAGVTLVQGRGVTAVTPFVATILDFERPVNNCAATATYAGSPNDDVWATVQAGGNDSQLYVWLIDDAGALQSGAGMMFHLILLCP